MVFVCVNCARGALEPSERSDRPTPPAIPWSGSVQEILVPCAGRLQPEHLLRAFEAGCDLVGIVACAPDNCHHLEGSCRAARRSEFVSALLAEIGLGGERLMLFHLPGSARADMAAAAPEAAATAPISDAVLSELNRTIAGQVAERLRHLPPSPLHVDVEAAAPEAAQAPQGPEAEDTDE